jgi:hypothetical protein
MKTKVLRVSVVTILSVGIWLTVGQQAANAQAAQQLRWDIIFFTSAISPGASGSATAADGSKITLTGTGTFVTPTSDSQGSSTVTGGGNWQTFPPGSTTASASGTYRVEGLVRFDLAPGFLPAGLLPDRIADLEDARAGLAVFRIAYSDGDQGVLIVSCMLADTPAPVIEGVSASKSYVDYFNIIPQATIFHVQD